jgi:photosystem II stability/assembly factor-like uncharacterized protein
VSHLACRRIHGGVYAKSSPSPVGELVGEVCRKTGSWGQPGTILATTDGGQRWTSQTNGTNADLAAVFFAADGRRG